jgi:Fe-S cluster biosynthesis and repair protein YggX
MSYFSLGNAYKDAERYEDAARALRKAIESDPALSRAYQLLGQSLIKAGADAEAASVLTTGYEVAAAHGDVMPMKAMGALLEKLGQPVPEVEEHHPELEQAGEGQIVCRRTGQAGPRLAEPPFTGPLGTFIADHFSQDTWRDWISQGTKVINELHLDLSLLSHQQLYDQHMMEWLGFTREEAEEHAAAKQTSDADA